MRGKDTPNSVFEHGCTLTNIIGGKCHVDCCCCNHEFARTALTPAASAATSLAAIVLFESSVGCCIKECGDGFVDFCSGSSKGAAIFGIHNHFFSSEGLRFFPKKIDFLKSLCSKPTTLKPFQMIYFPQNLAFFEDYIFCYNP